MYTCDLTTDYMTNPIGYDFKDPCFGWKTRSDAVGASQSAWQIQIATDASFEDALFDTGRVASDRSACVRTGFEPAPRTRYFWRVRIWDQDGREGDWSTPAFFETARMDLEWTARWIGFDEEFPCLRGDFRIEKPVASARAYACGLGLYALYVNGTRVGNEYLAPGFTPYDSCLPYQTYDITDRLRPGQNAIGCMLGNGYYKGRVNWPEIRTRFGDRWAIFGDRLAFICEVRLVYQDGTEATFVTDDTWRGFKGPYLRAEIYDGVEYDARAERDGWCDPDVDASQWKRAQYVPLDLDRLTARKNLPITLHERFRPCAVLATPAGETVLDFGQNLAGLFSFETDAPRDTRLTFEFGEVLDRHGNFYRDNMRTALARIDYICDGQKRFFRPEFTFFGFRYVRVTGWPGQIDPEAFASEALYSDMRPTGRFECSDARVNRLFENSLWSQKSNFIDVPTDCPQRDERLGWTGDAQVFCCTASMNMDTDAFFRKYLWELAIEQRKDDYVPVVVPNILRKTGIWQLPITAWGDAATIIPWTLYKHFGDVEVLRRQYPSMKAWVDFMTRRAESDTGLYKLFSLGDWLAQDTKDPDNWFGLTPTDLISNAYYALSARVLARTAAVLGYDEDAEAYASLEQKVTRAFRDEYVSRSGRVISETQTAQAVALFFDLLLPEQRPVAARHLAERVQADHTMLTTGFVGTPCLCPALSENGYNEYAYALLLQNACPSWLYEVEMGATTMWERWNSMHPDGSFGPVGMNSFNHYAFGAVCEWLYRYVAGINPVESAPGFKEILLKPLPNSQLRHASAGIDTPYGAVSSCWRIEESGELSLSFEIPFNARATIVLPDAEGARISENGQPLSQTGPLVRGSGRWTYRYRPNGRTIDRRVPPIVRPDI